MVERSAPRMESGAQARPAQRRDPARDRLPRSRHRGHDRGGRHAGWTPEGAPIVWTPAECPAAGCGKLGALENPPTLHAPTSRRFTMNRSHLSRTLAALIAAALFALPAA